MNEMEALLEEIGVSTGDVHLIRKDDEVLKTAKREPSKSNLIFKWQIEEERLKEEKRKAEEPFWNQDKDRMNVQAQLAKHKFENLVGRKVTAMREEDINNNNNTVNNNSYSQQYSNPNNSIQILAEKHQNAQKKTQEMLKNTIITPTTPTTATKSSNSFIQPSKPVVINSNNTSNNDRSNGATKSTGNRSSYEDSSSSEEDSNSNSIFPRIDVFGNGGLNSIKKSSSLNSNSTTNNNYNNNNNSVNGNVNANNRNRSGSGVGIGIGVVLQNETSRSRSNSLNNNNNSNNNNSPPKNIINNYNTNNSPPKNINTVPVNNRNNSPPKNNLIQSKQQQQSSYDANQFQKIITSFRKVVLCLVSYPVSFEPTELIRLIKEFVGDIEAIKINSVNQHNKEIIKETISFVKQYQSKIKEDRVMNSEDFQMLSQNLQDTLHLALQELKAIRQ